MKHKNNQQLRIGLVFMGCAIVGAIALYMWGQRVDKLPGSWDDMVATIYITYFCLPVFVVGLVIALVGWISKMIKGKEK
jgi:chromate transport protein ChrA